MQSILTPLEVSQLMKAISMYNLDCDIDHSLEELYNIFKPYKLTGCVIMEDKTVRSISSICPKCGAPYKINGTDAYSTCDHPVDQISMVNITTKNDNIITKNIRENM